jgi:hypothetical protein
MSAPTPNPQTPASPAERRLALLEQLAALGLRLGNWMEQDVAAAHAVQAAVAEEDRYARLMPPFDFAETSLAYARISRAIRLILALHARLEAGAYRPYPSAAANPGRAPRPFAASTAGQNNRDADAGAPADEATARLGEASERLSDPDELDALLDHPAADLIGLICGDLGLSHDQTAAAQARWAEGGDDTARLEAAQDAQDEAPPLLASDRRKGPLMASRGTRRLNLKGAARGP